MEEVQQPTQTTVPAHPLNPVLSPTGKAINQEPVPMVTGPHSTLVLSLPVTQVIKRVVTLASPPLVPAHLLNPVPYQTVQELNQEPVLQVLGHPLTLALYLLVILGIRLVGTLV